MLAKICAKAECTLMMKMKDKQSINRTESPSVVVLSHGSR